jgi:hypothetical protein
MFVKVAMMCMLLASKLIFVMGSVGGGYQTMGGVGVTIKNTCREPVDVSVYSPGQWTLPQRRLGKGSKKTIDICRGLDWCGYTDSWSTPRAHDFFVTVKGVKTKNILVNSKETITVSGTRPVEARLVMNTC